MIPWLLLHIALIAQLQNVGDCKTDGCSYHIDAECYGRTCVDTHANVFVQALPQPAEHVIEIRTKQEFVQILHYGEICPKGTEAVWVPLDGSQRVADAECERVTKTLWIDGQGVGVIKETEEK